MNGGSSHRVSLPINWRMPSPLESRWLATPISLGLSWPHKQIATELGSGDRHRSFHYGVKHHYFSFIQELQRYHLQNKSLLHPWQWVVLQLLAGHEDLPQNSKSQHFFCSTFCCLLCFKTCKIINCSPSSEESQSQFGVVFPHEKTILDRSCGQIFCPETFHHFQHQRLIEII